jgi:hypothetical protein
MTAGEPEYVFRFMSLVLQDSYNVVNGVSFFGFLGSEVWEVWVLTRGEAQRRWRWKYFC